MNRVARVLLLGGLCTGVLLAAASCSSDSSPPGGAGAGANSGAGMHSGAGASSGGNGASGFGTGGANNAGTGSPNAGASGTGTTGGAYTGGASGSGGTVSNAGNAGTGGGDVVCSTDPNLVKATDCWVGCDPTLSTDNPQGIQGAFYTFGDGSSCAPVDPPCSAAGICLSGSTAIDATYAKWGCGMGLELNATGGTPSAKLAYQGSASCFKYTLSGSSGGNEVRIAFTQSKDTTGKVSPYVSIPAFTNGKSGTICIKDVSCQGQMNCTVGTEQYDLQINVVGGNTAGAYNVCLTSLEPVMSGTSTLPQICGAQGSANATADIGKYFAQNNVFPMNNDNSLCITPGINGNTASFTVDSAKFATGATLNAYPSIVDGWHFGRISTDTALPKQLSALASANSSVTYTGSVGKYDAAYDIWVLPNAATTATKTPAGGLEVMVWLNSAGVNPAGSKTGTYMGWDVWTGTVESWKYVAYVKNGQTTFSGDLAPLIKNAASISGLPTSSYLVGIEFGFELYDYPGTGFAVKSFTSDVK